MLNPICWKCEGREQPDDMSRLALCATHLQAYVREKMLYGDGKPTINGSIQRWVEMPASGR